MSEEAFEVMDTTLRDGEQTPEVAFSKEEKLEIAKKLDEIGVHSIEAGSASVSKGERRTISQLMKEGLDAEIYSFCRGLKADIDHALECGVDGIHLVIPVSDLHIEKKLNKTREEIKKISEELTRYAADHGLTVEISGEDSTRAEMEFIQDVFSLAVEEGAEKACVCDTVGISTPEKMEELVSELVTKVDVPLSVHCHDDFGLATANTISALEAGAREAHLTMNGIGERGGNAALEEVIIGLSELYDHDIDIDIEKIYLLSKIVEKYSGLTVPASKALVGENSFTHEAGIHVDGIIKDSSTYEPIDPEKIGRRRRFVVGKHSGKRAIENKLEREGYNADEDEINIIFQKIKKHGDSGESIDEDRWNEIVKSVID